MASRYHGYSSIIGLWLLVVLGAMPPAALAAGPRAGGRQASITRLGSAPAAQPIQLVLPLKADEAGLQRLAKAVNTVGSPQYGQFEPLSMLARRFGALPAVRNRVLSYLRRSGATRVKMDATGLFADATMSVSLAQRLFGTSLAQFHGAREGRFIAPTAAARIPVGLRGAAAGVIGLDTRPLFRAPQTMAAGGAVHSDISGYSPRTGAATGCTAALAQPGFTPNQYLAAYGYGPLQASGVTGQGERVALIEIDGFRYRDLKAFASCFKLAVPAINGYGVGLAHPLAPGGETTLDLEVLDAAAPGLKEIDVYESRARAADVLRSLTAPLQNRGKTPQVISASLGTCEPALVASIGSAGIRAAEGALAAAAASGISVLASSGDDGSTACVGRTGPIDALADSYPASSPFVTGVGGTNVLLNADNSIASQTVWNDGPAQITAGGGGPSSLFRRPSYQNGFVLAGVREVPDLSLLADVEPGYEIYCTARPECVDSSSHNPWVNVGGTSAAAPLLAGGLALTDEFLRQHGRQQLGVANSLLYSIARSSSAGTVFSDVVTGGNDLSPFIGSRAALGCCNAGPGFDDASGLGSPNLSALAFLATASQPPIASVGVSLPRQRPLANRRLLARLSCSSRCLVGSYADISIGRARPFRVRSATHVLTRKGRRTVKLSLSGSDARRIRGGLRAHKQVEATVYGVVVDSGGNVESTSRGHRLRIR